AAADRRFRCLVDPDLIGPDDLADPTPGSTVRSILDPRGAEVGGFAADLRAARANAATPAAAWQALLANALPGIDLAGLDAAQGRGEDIDAPLASAGLTRSALGFLVHMG